MFVYLEKARAKKFSEWVLMLIYTSSLKWITNKVLLYSTGNLAKCYVLTWMGEESGGEQISVYVRLSPFAVHL